MKKLFLAIAAVAMVFATSCKKESTNAPEEPAGDNEFVCVIDQNAESQNAPAVSDDMGTLAHIDGSNNVWWQVGDEITYYGQEVISGQAQPADYHTLTCSKQTDGRAYFSDDDKHFGQGSHVAYYPATLYKGNDGLLLPDVIQLEAGKNAGFLPMYGTGTGAHYITFHNMCAVLKIAIPSSITTCNKIVLSAEEAIAGIFTMNGTKAVLNSTGTSNTIEVNAASGTNFSGIVYVAIPENTTGYTDFTVELKNGTTSLGAKTNPNAMPVEAGKIYPVTLNTPVVPTNCFYFTNQGTSTSTLQLKANSCTNSINLKYFKSGTLVWANFVNGTGNSEVVSIAPNDTIYIYSVNEINNISNGTTSDCRFFSSTGGGELKVGGKLSYLLSPNATDKYNSSYAFANLFYYMNELRNASGLILPNNSNATLPSYYYYSLFEGCTNLDTVFNDIEAGEFGSNSCYKMFYGCTYLKTLPTIKADKANGELGTYAFRQMASGCSSLQRAHLVVASGTTTVGYAFRQWLDSAGVSNAVLTVNDNVINSSTLLDEILNTKNIPTNWSIYDESGGII